MNANICVDIKDLECKVINGRKINVRAGLEVKIKLYSNEDIEIITGIENAPDVQILDENFRINSLIGKNSTRIYVKDTLNIDQQDEIAEILKTEVKLVDCDTKNSYNKVLSKCEVEVKIMYLTEDNRIGHVEGKIPAVGFIDMQNISDENVFEIQNEINNIIVRPNQAEEHSIYVEIEIETTCTSYEKKDIMLIQDLYSPSMNLGFSQKRITTPTEKVSKIKNFTITSKINIPELVDGYLLDTQVSTNINKEQLTSSMLKCEGDITVNFIFGNSNNNVNSKTSKIPFEFSIENPTQDENAVVETTLNVIAKRFEVKQNGDVDCTIDIEAKSHFSQNASMNIIENIMKQEDDTDSGDYDSLIIYIVQKGDTLWSIAKKFKSTVDDIARVNGIEDPSKIVQGQKLYIPKFRYTNRIGIVDEVSE